VRRHRPSNIRSSTPTPRHYLPANRVRAMGQVYAAQVAAALEPSTSSPLASTPFRASRSLRLIAIAAVPLSSCFFVNVEKEWMFVGR
jgi:hypothetical protein